MTLSPLRELELLLRPAGAGLHVVSTGREARDRLWRVWYGTGDEGEVRARFRERLKAIAGARVLVLGVPSDTGAGVRRGSNLAPLVVREEIATAQRDWWSRVQLEGVVDVGDVVCVPQLLADEMLSEAQKLASRAALFPEAPELPLPVSPLDITGRVVELLLTLNPHARLMVVGGDHSVAWPVAEALAKRHAQLGIVQPDAHTDLLESRLGVRICFATWSFHANELLGRGGRLVQVGVRASRQTKEHWEGTLGVRQFWADECLADGPATIERIVAHLHAAGVHQLYFSNDIDGTDGLIAPSTGTPEPNGLTPDFVKALIRRLAREFDLVAGDLMEVAPPIGSADERARTLSLSVEYFLEAVSALLQRRGAGGVAVSGSSAQE
jgi:arginase family enzyme